MGGWQTRFARCYVAMQCGSERITVMELCCAVAAVQVMEPNIMDRLREYVMANGHPQQAVEYLTDSYAGASGLVVVGA